MLNTQKSKMQREEFGGTMRLGAKKILINKNTKTSKIYNNVKTTLERHRHRYFINTDYTERLEKNGMIISAKAMDSDGSEIIENRVKKSSIFYWCAISSRILSKTF